jgi:hypothetical protein
MASLSPKENYLRALRHEEYEYIPQGMVDAYMCGTFDYTIEKGPHEGGLDGFGVRWVAPESGGGGPIPAPGEFMLKDVTQWKKVVKIPDVKTVNWAAQYEMENGIFHFDRDAKALAYACGNGIWERLGALMGFENACISLAEEPEAVNELFTALTDYKIKYAEAVYAAFKPDIFINFDDIATERSTFMSAQSYYDLIFPHHKQLNDAVRNLGMLPVQHTCGRAEDLIEGYIKTGAAAWNSGQPSNDIAGLLDKYGDQIVLEGGYNTNGKPGYHTATNEEIEAEVDRCFREYGGKKGFSFAGMIVVPGKDPAVMMGKMEPITNAAMKYRAQGK